MLAATTITSAVRVLSGTPAGKGLMPPWLTQRKTQLCLVLAVVYERKLRHCKLQEFVSYKVHVHNIITPGGMLRHTFESSIKRSVASQPVGVEIIKPIQKCSAKVRNV
jgi:hypothetical protein